MTADAEGEVAGLHHLTISDLRTRYRELFGDATRSGNRQYLVRKIAWRIQSLAEGGLTERARRRALELADESNIRTRPPAGRLSAEAQTGAPATSAPPRLPMPGTVITRKYKGRTVAVTVLTEGFEYEGELCRSLSAVARKVTGSHWNGRLFFGVKGGGAPA